MPQVIPAVVAAVGNAAAATAAFLGASAAAQWAIYAFVVKYGALIAFTAGSIAYSASQQRKLKKALSGAGTTTIDQGRTVMTRDPIAPRRYIYGQCLVSGPIAYMATSGTNNEYLHIIIVLASHECEELGDVYFNDELVPLSGNVPSSGSYVGYARVKKFLGLAAGERDTDLETESGGEWTTAHLGKGIARMHVRLKYSTDIFPNGIPTIKCVVKGKKVFDPRDGTQSSSDPTTWKWSANAALCVADFLHDSMMGKGVEWARIRMPDLIESANICDEDVVLAA